MKVVLAALWVLFSLGGCAATPEDQSDGPERAWNTAERFVPANVQNPPVIIFLHGCMGINANNRLWGRLLRDAGYLVIMPNSFARKGRSADCDPRTHTGQRDPNTIRFRRNEAIVAAEEVLKISKPPKLIVMGHSEGALTVQYWRGAGSAGFDAAIVSGTACNITQLRISSLPLNMPTLVIRFESDPWDPRPQECGIWASERPKTKLYLVPGNDHDPAGDVGAQREVLNFLRSLQ